MTESGVKVKVNADLVSWKGLRLGQQVEVEAR